MRVHKKFSERKKANYGISCCFTIQLPERIQPSHFHAKPQRSSKKVIWFHANGTILVNILYQKDSMLERSPANYHFSLTCFKPSRQVESSRKNVCSLFIFSPSLPTFHKYEHTHTVSQFLSYLRINSYLLAFTGWNACWKKSRKLYVKITKRVFCVYTLE